jgi:hypothetical protein
MREADARRHAASFDSPASSYCMRRENQAPMVVRFTARTQLMISNRRRKRLWNRGSRRCCPSACPSCLRHVASAIGDGEAVRLHRLKIFRSAGVGDRSFVPSGASARRRVRRVSRPDMRSRPHVALILLSEHRSACQLDSRRTFVVALRARSCLPRRSGPPSGRR